MTAASEADQQIEDEAGVRWTVKASFRREFDATIRGRGAALARGEGSRLVKGNQVRAVARFSAGPWEVFLKRHRITGWKDLLRYAFLPTRGANEWHKANLLLAHGFETAVPLAVGERRRGLRCLESFSVAEAIAPAIPIGEQIESLGGRDRHRFLERLGSTLRRLHDAGIHHRDLHGNNILVAPGHQDEQRLCFIDLHSVWSMPRIPRRARRSALAKLLGSIQEALSRADALRVVRAYLGRDERAALRRWWAGIQRAIDRERRRRLFTRTRRCLRESTRFRQSRRDGVRIRHRREIEPSAVLDWIRRFEGEVEWLKEGRRSRVGRVQTGHHGQVVGKELHDGHWASVWRSLTGLTRAERAWLAANGLRVRGIATPRPLACVRLSARRSLLFTRFLAAATPLDRLVAGDELPRSDRAALSEALAKFTATFHRRGVLCLDFAAKNLLVRREGDAWQILLADLDRLAFDDRRPSRYARLNLVQLNDLPPASATRTERLRFLHAYLRHHPIGDWKALFHEIDRETRARTDRYRQKVLRIYGQLPEDTYYPAGPGA